MEEMESEMLKDHDEIEAVIRSAVREGRQDGGRDILPAGRSFTRLTEAVYKIGFPLVTTALAAVVRTVVEKAIGG